MLASIALLALAAACGDDATGPRSGSLAVAVSGLPAGVDADLLVSGPGSYAQALDASATLEELVPGEYLVLATGVTTPDDRWAPAPATQTVRVAASTTPATASVVYTLTTGRLAVSVAGLPAGASASVTVTGPGGFSRALTSAATLTGLAPGAYAVTAADVEHEGTIWRPVQVTTPATVLASATPTAVTVDYAVGSGRLALTITGLPAGLAGSVRVTGPGGFTRDLTASTTLSALEPGAYTVSGRPVSLGATPYSASPTTNVVSVTAGGIASAAVAYRLFELDLVRVAAGLGNPVFLTAPPGDARLFVVLQNGIVRIIRDGQLLPTPFLDVRSRVLCCGEQGLLSMAFDPGFATNGLFYLYLNTPEGDIAIERYGATPGADVADPAATRVITVPHRSAGNHNGGLVTFGPDGMLWLATGDGGGAGDPEGNAQNLNSLLGKVLRIDVRTLPYTVPATNPFVGQAGRRGEIWASGLRNPWRYDFDTPPGGSATLYIADVGQGSWEEIDVAPAATAGLDYGWNVMEGAHCYPIGSSCNTTGKRFPVLEYSHADGCSITGGFVYRGVQLPEIAGHFFYSDYCNGWLASLLGDGSTWSTHRWSVPSVGMIVSFGEDGAGELYLLSATGEIWKLVRRAAR